MRRFKCRDCGFIHDKYHNLNEEDEIRLPHCCSSGFYEDESAAIYISHQEVLLGPTPNVLTGSVINQPLARLHLYDDLTQKINIGDAVSVLGHVYTMSFPPSLLPNSSNLFGEIQINVNNIVPPSFEVPRPWTDKASMISLEHLVEQFDGGKLGLQKKYEKVAIILSLASASSRANRRQVHLLFTTPSSLSAVTAMLKSAATLSARSVFHAGDKKLLASVERGSLHAGSLALSNGGVCIVELCKDFLTKEDHKSLCDAMDKEVVTTKNCPELVVPCTSTIWGIHTTAEKDRASKQGRKELLLRQLLHKFDIVLPLFEATTFGDESVRKFIFNFNGGAAGISSCKQHISLSSSIDTVTVTDEAQELISGYFLLVRRASETDDISLLTLGTLVRTASACARLCLRNQVVEVPDATLAIFLCEKTQQAKYESSALEHLSKKLTDTNAMEEKRLDTFLADFNSDLKRFIGCQPRLEE